MKVLYTHRESKIGTCPCPCACPDNQLKNISKKLKWLHNACHEGFLISRRKRTAQGTA